MPQQLLCCCFLFLFFCFLSCGGFTWTAFLGPQGSKSERNRVGVLTPCSEALRLIRQADFNMRGAPKLVPTLGGGLWLLSLLNLQRERKREAGREKEGEKEANLDLCLYPASSAANKECFFLPHFFSSSSCLTQHSHITTNTPLSPSALL